MIKTQKGSAALWIILVVVVIIAAGGYLYLKSSRSGAGTVPTEQVTQFQTETPPASASQSNTTNKTSGDVTHLTCDQVFPVDAINSAFPTMQFKLVKDAASNEEHLICAYDSGTYSNGTLKLYEGLVTIYPLNPPAYTDSIRGYQLLLGISGNNTNQFKCLDDNIGIKSSYCTGTLSLGINEAVAVMIFAPSNSNYDVSVSLITPTAVGQAQQIVEQMAKEVNLKLSSY